MICFEYLSLSTFLTCLFKFNILKKLVSINSNPIYFIDSSLSVRWFVIPIITFFGKKINKLNFKLIEITDNNGELIRYRIARFDLFEVQKKITDSISHKELYHQSWNQGSILDYINKAIVGGSILESESVSRVLFLIEVLNWHMKKINCEQALLIINKRPWLDIYKKIAKNYQIVLLGFHNIQFKLSDIHNFVRNHQWLYGVLKNLKYNKKIKMERNSKSSLNMLYLDGRRDINIEKNGNHSDFFWQYNSHFPIEKIIYKYYSSAEKLILNQYGVLPIPEGVIIDKNCKRNYVKPKKNYSNVFQKESKILQLILASYDLDRFYWSAFFKFYNVKVFLSWNKYTHDHIALLDAINDNDGILAIWQMAFDGFEFAECALNADIYFCFSRFSLDLEKKLKSKIKYNIITGYPKDYAGPLLKERASNLRKKLKANGAKKIIFVIDENSTDDSRWHTGHEIQRENYSFVLNKVLETSWLGVIFKPKTAKTLRKRLGSVADLLTKAEKTGRCFIYEKSVGATTIASPVLAGLSSDICIHAHLGSGTGAVECALEGLPTLLIDREGAPFSKLNELPLGKVIFKDWTTTIKAVMEHFDTPGGIDGFGDWSKIIDDLDPFRDGKAAYRMGTYLHWLVQGYNQGLDKKTALFQAATRYKKKWGEDKVITT